MAICGIMKEAVHKTYPDAAVESIPVADGGEGSVDCFLQALGGEKVWLPVKGPVFEEIDAFYGLIDSGKTAVIEMAACAGLPLMGDDKDPCITTTYGVGQLMMDAAARGVTKIIMGLGGSATNDGGCGAAAAAGIRFYNSEGEAFVPVGGSLHQIHRIDSSGKSPLLQGIEIVTMCDIDNPMFGLQGAAHIFAPQKGADEKTVLLLDEGLRHLSAVMHRDMDIDAAELPGSGAAGAMGAGMFAFFGARLEMGIQVVLDTVRFEELIRDADLILTGEGKIDSQSLRGKVVIGVARRAKPMGVPVVAVVGDIDDNIENAYEQGVSGIFSINRVAVDFKLAKHRSSSDMGLTVDNLMRFCKRMGL